MTRTGRCICGIKVAHHFNSLNHKLSCEQTRQLHPRAALRSANLRRMFLRLVTKESINGQA